MTRRLGVVGAGLTAGLIAANAAVLGLSGVVTGKMQVRNVGILGYVVVFFAVALCLSCVFREPAPSSLPPRGHH